MTGRTLYLVTCGAPLAARAVDGIHEARDRGWDPILIPTDAAIPWLEPLDLSDVEVITGNRLPGEPKRVPPPDAVVVAPMTFNTLTAWANGTANTFPLTTLCAALGARVPTVAVPFAKHDLAGHPAWLASLAVLRCAGVTIVDPSTGAVGSVDPIESGSGEDVAAGYHWPWALDLVEP
ncbi:flavoprotein [Nocardioides speluncae]|uniref:flavoprotein n=1 Tax=Nocardioides speluncae TaxID=2670337 RepID=UPI000D69F554|nr:flavoprotein [Nocardioides speluncae]